MLRRSLYSIIYAFVFKYKKTKTNFFYFCFYKLQKREKLMESELDTEIGLCSKIA
jgi:hypothetical protein